MFQTMQVSDSFCVYRTNDRGFLWIAYTCRLFGWPADLVVCYKSGKAVEFHTARADIYAKKLAESDFAKKFFAPNGAFRPSNSPAVPVQGFVRDFAEYKNRFFCERFAKTPLDVFVAPKSQIGW